MSLHEFSKMPGDIPSKLSNKPISSAIKNNEDFSLSLSTEQSDRSSSSSPSNNTDPNSNYSLSFRDLKRSLEGLPRGIWAVSLSNLLIAIAVSMAFSVSPFFLTQTLNISRYHLSLIEGFSEATAQISKFFSGVLGDIFRRQKPLMIFGLILSTLSKPFFIMADGMGMIMLSKLMERVSNGVIATPRDAFVATHAPADRRGTCFGLLMTLKTAGCVIGPLIVGLIMLLYTDYKMLLWIGVIPGILSIMIAWRFMDDNPEGQSEQEKNQTDKKSKGSNRQSIKLADIKALPFEFWSILAVSTLFMMARFSDSFLALRWVELGASTALSAITIGIFNFISVIACLPVGRISDRVSLTSMLSVSFICLILSNFFLAIDGNVWTGLAGVLFWGGQRGTSQMLFSTVIAKSASKKIIGTAIGLSYIVTGVAALLAGAIGGKIADYALKYAFYYGGAISSVALVALFIREAALRYRARKGIA